MKVTFRLLKAAIRALWIFVGSIGVLLGIYGGFRQVESDLNEGYFTTVAQDLGSLYSLLTQSYQMVLLAFLCFAVLTLMVWSLILEPRDYEDRFMRDRSKNDD
jgi:hypothetical protein